MSWLSEEEEHELIIRLVNGLKQPQIKKFASTLVNSQIKLYDKNKKNKSELIISEKINDLRQSIKKLKRINQK